MAEDSVARCFFERQPLVFHLVGDGRAAQDSMQLDDEHEQVRIVLYVSPRVQVNVFPL